MQKGGLVDFLMVLLYFGFLMVLLYFGFHKCLKICNKMIHVTTKLSLSLIRYGNLYVLNPIGNVQKTKS